MLGSYFKSGWRSMKKRKGYAFLNVAGLALGMAAAVLIALYIRHELSFDRFHEKAARIHRVTTDATLGQHVTAPSGPTALAPELAERFPDVEACARVKSLPKTLVTRADRRFYETGLLFADASFFDVFSFPLLSGDPRTALARPGTIVLTETLARKYVPGGDPLGQVLRLNDEGDFVVTGVLKDVPGNSHLRFDGLVSFETRLAGDPDLRRDWTNLNTPTYVLFRDERGPERVAPRLAALVEERLRPMLKAIGGRLEFRFQPLGEIHLFSRYTREYAATGNVRYLYLFAAVAVFLVGIGCINFMNLATARASQRAREIGLRKSLGAGRRALVIQFLGDAILHSGLALAAAVLLVWFALPVFRSVVGIDLTTGVSRLPWLASGLLGLAVVVGLAAGSYPALYLSALPPVGALKGAWKAAPGGARFRHVLVVVQFVIGVTLIIGTLVVRRQLEFMRSRDLGFSPTQILVVRVDDPGLLSGTETLKNRLLEIPGVASAAMTDAVPGQELLLSVSPYRPEGLPDSQPPDLFRKFDVDADLVPTLGLEIVKGRNFSREMATDEDGLVINEALARHAGWADPIGRKIKALAATRRPELGWKEKTVIGVVRDFHFLGLQRPIEPYLLQKQTGMSQLVVKLRTERLGGTIRELERAWREIAPGRPLDYFFLDAFFDAQYRAEERLGRLVTAIGGLAIAIACLGLFGLASFLAEQKAREIAIRRVLGASVRGLLFGQSFGFLRLVALSTVLAAPVAYGTMSGWLRSFAYRATLTPWTFVAAGAAALAIAFVTVAGQAYRAAAANPASVIKYE